ncbi:MAG TPA: efflux RND transporter periplasmic adaptor subunit [Solirubrobacteraceae bacterium]
MPKYRERPSLNIFLGLLGIGAVVVAYTSVGKASQTAASSRRTATVARGVVQSTVSGSGNLAASSELDVGFKTAGVVTHVYVKQGEHVLSGQLLATLDPESAEVTLEQAKASLESAQASLVQEEEDDGEASTSTSSSSEATREANVASAKATVRSDALTVKDDEEAVQDTKLYAPEDGTIVTLSGEVGETVSATSGSSFAVLSDLSSMKLVVSLSESEIGEVKDGQPATVTVEALSGAKLAARVSEVSMLSTSSSEAVSYDVTFLLEQMRPGLKAGMSAVAEVVVEQAEGVNVPTSAISGETVTVLRAGRDVSQAITKGLAGNTTTIVLSGLKAGETVVLPEAQSTSSSSASSSSKSAAATSSGTLGGSAAGGLGAAAGGGLPTGAGPGGGGPP